MYFIRGKLSTLQMSFHDKLKFVRDKIQAIWICQSSCSGKDDNYSYEMLLTSAK